MTSLKKKITGGIIGATTAISGGIVAINPNCILSDVHLEDERVQICLSDEEYAEKKDKAVEALKKNYSKSKSGGAYFETIDDFQDYILILNEEIKQGNVEGKNILELDLEI